MLSIVAWFNSPDRWWNRKKPAPQPPPDPDPLPEKETDLAYGPDPLQTLDVYRPPNTMPGDKLPVILMVHGGGWDNTLGDKANAGVIDNKIAHYLPLGYMVVSMNYRLYPQVTPLQEMQDVAAAYTFVQKLPGVDPARIGLMGHSAGGTNVAVAAASMVKPHWVVTLDAGTSTCRTRFARRMRLAATSWCRSAPILWHGRPCRRWIACRVRPARGC